MKSKNSKLIFKFSILAFSLVCFFAVNMANIDNANQSNIANLSNIESRELPLKDSRMPDLKLFKNVIILIGKFLPAK
jgi:hypothetical protein